MTHDPDKIRCPTFSLEHDRLEFLPSLSPSCFSTAGDLPHLVRDPQGLSRVTYGGPETSVLLDRVSLSLWKNLFLRKLDPKLLPTPLYGTGPRVDGLLHRGQISCRWSRPTVPIPYWSFHFLPFTSYHTDPFTSYLSLPVHSTRVFAFLGPRVRSLNSSTSFPFQRLVSFPSDEVVVKHPTYASSF